MASSINASLTAGLVQTADTSGIINLQSGGTTVATISSTGVAVTGTLSSTGNTTLGDASTDTLNVGNGDLVKDASGNVGIGVTPRAWTSASGFKSIDFTYGSVYNAINTMGMTQNAYFNGTNFIYNQTSLASYYYQNGGAHNWSTAPSGTAGTAITFTTAMTLDASGNLGIGGTPVAGYKLDIVGNTMRLAATVAGNGYETDAGSTTLTTSFNRTTSTWLDHTYRAKTHTWNISGSTAMTLDASGNLLVGTTTTTNNVRLNETLGVVYTGNGSYAGMAISGYSGTAPGARPLIDINRSRGTTDGSMTAVAAEDYLGSIIFRGSSGTAFSDAGMISCECDGVSSGPKGRLTFWTTNTGGTLVERMRIDSSGNLLVGTAATGLPNANHFSYLIGSQTTVVGHINGTVSGTAYAYYTYNGSVAGSITQNGTTGVLYNITSDYRLKDVLGAVTGHGERIDALEPVEYDWKSDGSRARGFIAHKFQEVYPNSVTGEKDAVDEDGNPKYQTMQSSTSEVIADLVAEIQSLRIRSVALEAIITSLTARLEVLENK